MSRERKTSQNKRKKSEKIQPIKHLFLALLFLLIIVGAKIYQGNFSPKSKVIYVPVQVGEQSSSLWSTIEKILVFYIFIQLVKYIFGFDIAKVGGNFLTSLIFSPRIHQTYVPNLRFKDIGGLAEAKEELGEIVKWFNDPQFYQEQGIKFPAGVLLVGPPGNGKTLLAKALAGECGRPFLFRSGSEFEEMVVGLGARRMRELFQEARSYPNGCVIFIDEIDSIAKKRHSLNSSTDLTLNQLLNELDGFYPRENIIILAATNTPEILDKALLRPGRFDRQIHIPLPNLKARREIINLEISRIRLKFEVDLEEIANMTWGFSGAQIVNLFNEAALFSLRNHRPVIDQDAIFEAQERVLIGPVSLSHTFSPEKKKIIAYHEAGHAMVGLVLLETEVKKVTIVPRLATGGHTWVTLQGEQGDDYLINKKQLLAQVMVALAGRASEELIFGSERVTVGASGDLQRISELLHTYLLHYGISEPDFILFFNSSFHWEKSSEKFSEKTKEKIAEVKERIIKYCWKKVKSILLSNKQRLTLLATVLLERNSLSPEEINYIFINNLSPFRKLLK